MDVPNDIDTSKEAEDAWLLERISTDFTYHKPKPGQPEKYTELRDTAKALAVRIVELAPAGRERAIALTKLEEVVMWANAGIARHE